MIRKLLASGAIVVCCLFAAPLTVNAAFDPISPDPDEKACNNAQTADEAAACKSRAGIDPVTGKPRNPLTGPNGTIIKASRIVAIVAGAAAVILLLVSGLRYVTSSGDSNKISSAKSTFINTLIGLIIIVLAHTLIVFVVSRL